MKTNRKLKQHGVVLDHPSDKIAVEIVKCRQIMKQQANSTNDRPNQIITFSTATALDDVKARLPQPDTVMRVLRRARAQHRPKDPSSLQELTIPKPLESNSRAQNNTVPLLQ